MDYKGHYICDNVRSRYSDVIRKIDYDDTVSLDIDDLEELKKEVEEKQKEIEQSGNTGLVYLDINTYEGYHGDTYDEDPYSEITLRWEIDETIEAKEKRIALEKLNIDKMIKEKEDKEREENKKKMKNDNLKIQEAISFLEGKGYKVGIKKKKNKG